MEVFLLAAFSIYAWVASLLYIVIRSICSSSSDVLANKGFSERNMLLVISHPDDESMFFSPTINYLRRRGYNVHILCISIGNSDGLGRTRKEELYGACLVLKVPLEKVSVVDHPELQDGFGKVWNHDLLANLVEHEVLAHDIKLIISFDSYGISGHCNHRDTHRGVRKFMGEAKQMDVEAWELDSVNLLRKYSGPVGIWLSLCHSKFFSNGQLVCLVNENPRTTFLAMAEHRTQWIWFRKLFVGFSSYNYVNTLRKI